jgi:DNA-binding GntR family transcriptional regulator
VSEHAVSRLHLFEPSDAPPQLTVGIHEALKRAILEGRLRPSERINQEQVARELGVSRTPVREALHWLARDGLVDLQPRRGAFVSAFDERDVFEIYDLRELLEPHAAARACLLATPADAAALRRLEREIEQASASDMELAFALNRDFHHRLCRPCENRLLMTLLDTVWSQQSALRIFTYYQRSAEATAQTNVEHRAIVEAFAARDPERVRELVRAHISGAHRRVVELMAVSEAAETAGKTAGA